MDHPSMTEKELLTDLLNEEKSMVKAYASDVTEAACQNLRQLLVKNMSECAEDQFNVFQQMKQRNMYNPKEAQQADVQQAKTKVQQLRQETGF